MDNPRRSPTNLTGSIMDEYVGEDAVHEKIKLQATKNQLLRERLQEIRERRYQIQQAIYRSKLPPNTTNTPTGGEDDDDDEENNDSTNVPLTTTRDAIGGGVGMVEDLLDAVVRERQDALKSYQSILTRRRATSKFLKTAQQWNVMNDCFHIWHQGPYGTINGLRLGLSEAGTVALTPISASATAVTAAAARSSSSSFSNGTTAFNHGDNSINHNHNNNASTNVTAATTPTSSGPASPTGWYRAATSPAPTPAASSSSRGYWLSSMSPFSSSFFTSSESSTTAAASDSGSSLDGNQSSISSNSIYANGGMGAMTIPPCSPLTTPSSSTPPQPVKIAWIEINSALGHIALLLSSWAAKQQPPGSMPYFPHEIYPMGSSSKIGILRRVEPPTQTSSRRTGGILSSMTLSSSSAATTASTTTTATTTTPPPTTSTTELVTLYNLCYADESFSLFGKRNFNTALQCLLQCIQTAAETTIQKRDRTMQLPHAIGPLNNKSGTATTTPAAAAAAAAASSTTFSTATTYGGELGIGGLSLAYGVADPLEWTRAMKYLLTNVKWLVAYSAKHVDR